MKRWRTSNPVIVSYFPRWSSRYTSEKKGMTVATKPPGGITRNDAKCAEPWRKRKKSCSVYRSLCI